jgi:hypothetical protein
MKIDKSKHKHSWRIQKGCRVEWFLGNKKGSGVVTRVVSSDGPWDTASEVKVLDDATKSEIVLSADKLRILKTQNTLNKEKR